MNRELGDERGASMVEYALLIVLVALIAVIAISLAGGAVRDVFEQVPPAFETEDGVTPTVPTTPTTAP